jgi:macrolide-specific efflux system membrane fusion protein
MKLKILAVVALGAVGVGAAVYSTGLLAPSATASTQFLTSPATTGDVTQDVAATGTLAAQARYALVFGGDPTVVADGSTPESTGTWPVTEVTVAVGDTVKKGDILAIADRASTERDLAVAQNTLASAQVSLRAARTTLSDARDAEDTGQIRQAKIGYYDAKNRVAQAKQDVTDLKATLKSATITAPIDGVVTEVSIQAGYDAPGGAAIVLDAAGFQITTDVVESDLADIKIGQKAAVTISAVDADLAGTVTAISPVAGTDDGSGIVSYPVTVTLDEAPATLRSGMSADVTITIASATGVLTIPAEALQGATGDYRVRVLGADGTPTSQAVEVGLVTATLAEIKSGLTEGQTVITGLSSAQNGNATNNGSFSGGTVAIPGGGFGGDRPRQFVTNGQP